VPHGACDAYSVSMNRFCRLVPPAYGIDWAIEKTSPAVLHAYDASDLTHELYNSNQASNGRRQLWHGNKFITPMIADRKVFAATINNVALFGVFPSP
jgi:hypothetical protein